ncbi:hypothetical protein OH77DRAFT_491467 [Trametes cingulata]|nr:hypothetical protein OH77DRAFT_491467 [Trametes cingulata]
MLSRGLSSGARVSIDSPRTNPSAIGPSKQGTTDFIEQAFSEGARSSSALLTIVAKFRDALTWETGSFRLAPVCLVRLSPSYSLASWDVRHRTRSRHASCGPGIRDVHRVCVLIHRAPITSLWILQEIYRRQTAPQRPCLRNFRSCLGRRGFVCYHRMVRSRQGSEQSRDTGRRNLSRPLKFIGSDSPNVLPRTDVEL